ncbi:MAG: energy-coupling factor transporter transmembrane component T [Candidatus Aenigmarchaeota archaeon]|nr:energy-coupling factor transporter transmembrane component T [Candidatus Aenigmarchaeota archaeon]
MFGVFILSFILSNIISLLLLLISIIFMWFLVKVSVRELVVYLKSLTVLAIFIFLMHVLFPRGYSLFTFQWEGLQLGILMVLRLLVIILSFALVATTTSINDIATCLAKVKLPYEIVFAFTLAFNLIPSFKNDLDNLICAQKARGGRIDRGKFRDRLRAYASLITPLIINGLRKAQQIRVAMESRAFGAFNTRTYISTSEFTRRDYVISIMIMTIVITIMIFKSILI